VLTANLASDAPTAIAFDRTHGTHFPERDRRALTKVPAGPVLREPDRGNRHTDRHLIGFTVTSSHAINPPNTRMAIVSE
jgi:hypothetical protein